MTTLIDDHRVRAGAAAPARYFYFHMALACMAVAFLGFAPTYWLPLAAGSFASTPVVHFHGLLFFTWTLYFAFQTWLAASGRAARHRSLGVIGVSLATAMTIFGFLAAVNAMKRSAAIGQTDAGIAFAIVPLSGILFFAVVFALAIANTRRPEIHKRLMLLAGISILDAAVARWFLTFLAPPDSVLSIRTGTIKALAFATGGALLGFFLPVMLLQSRIKRRQDIILKAMPDERFAISWPHILKYANALGFDKRADAQPLLIADKEPDKTDLEKAADDPKIRQLRPARDVASEPAAESA